MKTVYEKKQKFQSRSWPSWETKALHHLSYITSLAYLLMSDKRNKKRSHLQKQLVEKSVNLYHLKTELNHLNDRLFLLIHKLCWEIF